MNIQPRYSKEEFARRGDAIYDDQLRPVLEKANEGKFVAIDIETGAYEVDSDELAASDRLVARVPNAQIWLSGLGHVTRVTSDPADDPPWHDYWRCHEPP